MSLLDAFVLEPFSVNEPLIDSLLLDPDAVEVFIADSPEKGSGTAWDPYGAQTAAVFDGLMNSFPPNTTVHLGPGTFLTHGHADGVAGGWQPRRRFRIVGAGVDITTLKLDFGTLAPEVHARYFVIGGDDNRLLDECEFADFTIDCNLKYNATTVQVAAGGIKAFGSHVRIRRLRVIDFGTQTNLQCGVAISTAGAFPENPEPFDCVVEDCVIDEPYANSVRESVCIEFAGGENGDGVMGNHKGCVVRNCLINCMYIDREVPLLTLAISGSTATGITKVAHGRTNEWACITGALINDSLVNSYNGSYQISGSGGQFTYSPTSPLPTVDPAGEIYIGRAPCHRIGIQTLALSGSAPDITAELTSRTPHNRAPSQNVRLNNVLVGGALSGLYNQPFPIIQLVSPWPVKLQFSMSTDPGTADVSNAYLGVDFYGIVVNGGRSIILENNRILNTTFGVYHGEWSTKDAIIRDNYFYNVLSAVYFKLGWVSQTSAGTFAFQPNRAGDTLARGGAGNLTATFTSLNAHGLAVGQAVAISEDNSSSDFNGIFVVSEVPTPTVFKYQMAEAPDEDAADPKFGALWQVGRLIIENNIVELILPIAGTPDAPTAIRLERKASTPPALVSPYVFQQAFIRGNTIRHADNASDPAGASAPSLALQLQSCASAIIEDNVIRLDRATPIEFSSCDKVKFFNNQSTAGKLIQGYKTDSGAAQLVNELETDVDLGLVSAV